MDTMIGVIGLVVIIAIAWGIHTLVGKGAAAVGDAVTGNSKARSQTAVHKRLSFDSPASADQLIERIKQNLDTGATGLRYRANRVNGGVALTVEKPGLGASNMSFVVTAVDEERGTGCKGFAQVQSWREAQGRVDSVKAIEKVQSAIREAVEHFGGELTESVTNS